MIERLIKCEDCGQSFWHRVEHRSDPNPDECPLCHNSGEPVMKWPAKTLSPKIAQMVEEGRGPATSLRFAKNADNVYRQMETASESRAQMAADAAGVDVSEMSNMKITDLRDNLRPGDVAAKLPPNRFAQQANGVGPGFTQSPVAPGGAPIALGGLPKVGDSVRQNLTAGHAQRQRDVVRAGEVARFRSK